MIKFQVRGSAPTPYTVTAEGEGDAFRMFCTCPAGRKGGTFCKHASALLMGDVSKLVGASDNLEKLMHMSEGSPLVGRALVHRSADQPDLWVHIRNLGDVATTFGVQFKALGFDLEIRQGDGQLGRDELKLFGHTNRGKRKVNPTHLLYYQPFTTDNGEWDSEKGELTNFQTIPRQKPWGYDGKTFAVLSRLIPTFLAGVGVP